MLVKARLQLMDEEYERERERVRLCARLGEVDAAIDCVRRRMAALEARYLHKHLRDGDHADAYDDDNDDVFADTCAPVSSCDTLEHNYDTMMMDVNDDDVIVPE
jgi:hypothetical protein